MPVSISAIYKLQYLPLTNQPDCSSSDMAHRDRHEHSCHMYCSDVEAHVRGHLRGHVHAACAYHMRYRVLIHARAYVCPKEHVYGVIMISFVALLVSQATPVDPIPSRSHAEPDQT